MNLTMKILPASIQGRKRMKRKMKRRITHYLQVRLIPFLLSHLLNFYSELAIHKGNTRLMYFLSWLWLLHLAGLDYTGMLIQNNKQYEFIVIFLKYMNPCLISTQTKVK